MNKITKESKIIVLGGSGFIGTNMLLYLKSSGYKNLKATYFKKIFFYKVSGIKYFKVNLRVKKSFINLIKNADVVLMLAANSSGAKIMQDDPLVHFNENIKINLNVIEECYSQNVKKFFFISSSTVYPNIKKSVSENDVNYSFFDKYHVVGWMKLFTEKICEIYASKINNPKMDFVIIRPSNLYGPYDKFSKNKSKVIPALIRRFNEGKLPIEIWGNGNDIKDFMYIEDFCKSLIKILPKKIHFDILNFSSGSSISIKYVIKLLCKFNNIKSNQVFFNSSKPSMIPVRKVSNKKLIKKYNIVLNHTFEKGLLKTINWYKKNKKIYNNI